LRNDLRLLNAQMLPIEQKIDSKNQKQAGVSAKPDFSVGKLFEKQWKHDKHSCQSDSGFLAHQTRDETHRSRRVSLSDESGDSQHITQRKRGFRKKSGIISRVEIDRMHTKEKTTCECGPIVGDQVSQKEVHKQCDGNMQQENQDVIREKMEPEDWEQKEMANSLRQGSIPNSNCCQRIDRVFHRSRTRVDLVDTVAEEITREGRGIDNEFADDENNTAQEVVS